ncbi:MAG: nitroreductase family protein, partial [Eubacterium sp.]|nr:nitroreductase family protein [Eubacterium sp.]
MKEGLFIMTFKELAVARYSVKNYTDRPVEEEKLQEILKVAGIAPTARNAQAIRIYVLKSEEAMEK